MGTKKQEYILQGTNESIIEPALDRRRLRVFIGTNDMGEKVKVYVSRIEKMETTEQMKGR